MGRGISAPQRARLTQVSAAKPVAVVELGSERCLPTTHACACFGHPGNRADAGPISKRQFGFKDTKEEKT